jgi:hypothetical protein
MEKEKQEKFNKDSIVIEYMTQEKELIDQIDDEADNGKT